MSQLKIERTMEIIILLASLYVAWPAAVFSALLLVWAPKFSAAPMLFLFICLSCPYLFRKSSLTAALTGLAAAAIMVAVAILGRLVDFTAYEEGAPGPYEWVNSTSLMAAMAVLLTALFSVIKAGKLTHNNSFHD